MQGGSKDSYSAQVLSSVPNLYPHAQPTVYPPPPAANLQGQPQPGYQQYQYQRYFGEETNNPSSYGWSEHPPPPAAQSPGPAFQQQYGGYQEDPDCITFLRGCFAGLCCCCLLEQCCL